MTRKKSKTTKVVTTVSRNPTPQQTATKKKRKQKKAAVATRVAPIAIASKWSGSRFEPFIRNGNIGIRASELLHEVTVPAGGAASSSVLYSTNLNPTVLGSGKLANFAANYDQFKFSNVKIEFVPSRPTTDAGTINMSFDRDPVDHRSGVFGPALDRLSGSDQIMMSDSVWECSSLIANNKWLNSSRQMFFVKPTDSEGARWWSQGTFYFQNLGPLFSGSTEATMLGTLYVHYDVTFKDFQLSSIPNGNSFLAQSLSPTDGNWFAGASFSDSNNLDIQVIPSTEGADHDLIFFPSAGVYFINTWGWWSGTINTDATFAFPDISGGNTVDMLNSNIEGPQTFPIESGTSGSNGCGLYIMRVNVVNAGIPLMITQVATHEPDNMVFHCFLSNSPVIQPVLPGRSNLRSLEQTVEWLGKRLKSLEISRVAVPPNSIFDPNTGKTLVCNSLGVDVSNTPNVHVTNTPAVTVSGQPIGVVVEASRPHCKPVSRPY